MTQQEASLMMTQLYNLYSGKHIFKENLTPQDEQMNLGLFYRHFKQYRFDTVQNALDHILSNRVQIYGFGDLIGALKEAIAYNLPKMDFGDAWKMVLKSCSCNENTARERFNKLPANIQKAIKSYMFLVELGWSSQEQHQFFRKELETNLKEVMEDNSTQFLIGKKSYAELCSDITQPKLLDRKESELKSIGTLMNK